MMTKNINGTYPDTLSYEEYAGLEPNVHAELVNSLINSEDSKGHKGIKIYRTEHTNSNELFTHSSFDIIYTASGNADVTVKGAKLTLAKHNMLFIAPGVPYRVSVDKDSIVPVITVNKQAVVSHFHRISNFDGMLPRFFANAMWAEASSSHILYTKLNNPNMHSLIRLAVSEQLHSSAETDFVLAQLMLCVFGYLAVQPSSTHELSQGKITKSVQIAKILTFIQNNYRTVTLEMLAEHFHYTVPYVSKLIRSATGLTFTEILREIKFDVCRSLLLNSDLKINKIAEVAGFQNTDHFNRVFKKRMGETPTEYKKNKTGIDK